MARQPRLDIPGVSQHVIQRGNNRLPCFAAERDYVQYLEDLREIARSLGCSVHAYVLMTNHVHLLLTPKAAGSVGRMMQALGRRYVRSFNDRYQRSGTLWEGRYKACPVDSDRYLLTCQRYIELNPVRAAIVAAPGDYRWSSYKANAFGVPDPLVEPHASYLALAPSEGVRRASYRDLVGAALSDEELEIIRTYTRRQHALGDADFQDRIEAALNRRARPGRSGRPKKNRGQSTVST